MSATDNWQEGQAAAAVERESLRRDLGTVADAIRTLNSDVDSKQKQFKATVVAGVSVAVSIFIAAFTLLLSIIDSNNEQIDSIQNLLRQHEIEAAYHRGRVEAQLKAHDDSIQKFTAHRESLVNHLAEHERENGE